MGANSSAFNPTQDFLARMGGGRLFDMGASAVKHGISFTVVQLVVISIVFINVWQMPREVITIVCVSVTKSIIKERERVNPTPLYTRVHNRERRVSH